ncbi:MAG: hypothetical protein CFE62_006505 [Candidatus Aquirickettsiella gammari]|uniref:Transposase n=1 Tax=Candidatus Aquirickettsiella gammari TaxID=2016198 RepID=A0A370CHL2_9COXI|nr:MAG: hypothetical protein CFE62_006505 [Candidatus Aquirickettsiella gammari]
MGRPSKFNPTLAKNIIEDIAQLVPYTITAKANQIDRSTLYDWINQGLADIQAGKNKTEFAQFSDAIKKSQCQSVKELLKDIKKGEKAWQSRAWLLERRFPMEFSLAAEELAELKLQIEEIKQLIKSYEK